MSFSEFKKKYHVDLNEQQEKAVQAVDGPVLLLAVPGSGKTTVLINRLGYMVFDRGIAPENILTVTYTVAATRDMQNRFICTFGERDADRLEFRTINSLSQKILYTYGRMTGKEVYSVIENKAKAELLKRIFTSVNHTYATENDIKDMETAITFVKNMRLSAEQIEHHDTQVDHFQEIYDAYQKELKKNGLIDFDDQMVYALMILQRVPDMLQYFQDQYLYICVDEAQDTSKLQHDIINLLAAKSGNLFMVGDEDQSIYGFRAAYPEALVSFEKVHKGAKVLLMEANYRSTEEIVKSADHLIQNNTNRHDKHMHAIRPTGGKIVNINMKSRKAQLSDLIKVAADCETETAVLYRNHESALPLIDMLERRQIPYRMKSNEITFFTHPVVTDISDFIRLALDPCDADAFMRIYYKMGAGISKTMANYVVDYHGHKPLLDAIDDLESISPYTRKQCRSLSTHFTNMCRESAGKAVYRILHFMGYQDYMNDRGLDYGKAEVLQMLANEEPDLAAFLPRLNELKEIMTGGNGVPDSKLILSTIHSSKGLEYDTVYMMDMMDGILPSIPEPKGDKVDPADVSLYEEERRLYYVGMTRAKNALFIFTFDPASTSAFSKCVFGSFDSGLYKEKSTKHKNKEDISRKLEDYEQGVIVCHKKFGKGVVVAREGNVAEIYFEGMDQRKMISLEVAVSKGLLYLPNVD